MKYHDITKCDMKNGDGLRVVLWVSGCNHYCPGCQNPVTWNPNDGLVFNRVALKEIYKELEKPHIAGLTISGGDPLYLTNRWSVLRLVTKIRKDFPNKTIWIYTGYEYEEVLRLPNGKGILNNIDVLVDGHFLEGLLDETYPWAGSTNQRVIDVQKSLERGSVVLHESH